MCGANMRLMMTFLIESGSSPRVRGERSQTIVRVLSGRIIPACAGRTGGVMPRAFAASDHPRVCGANRRRDAKGFRRVGSSPRVRGERCRVLQQDGIGRIIPACAGRTRAGMPERQLRKDHPRVCGANGLCEPLVNRGSGSSPRVRGELKPQ